MEQMTQYMVEITPEMAQEMLDKTTKENRNIRAQYLKGYVRNMQSGNWKPGSVIAIDTNDNVIDGQHRLKSVILSGMPQKFYIRSNVDPKDAVFDIGATRNINDTIRILNPDMLEIYKMPAATTFINGILAQDRFQKVTFADVIEYIQNHDDTLRPFIERILSKKTHKKRICAMPIMIGLYLAYVGGVSLNDIDYFYEVFKTGFANGEQDIPIIATRNWFLEGTMGGGAEVKREQIKRIQYGLNQYLLKRTSNRYHAPNTFIWGFPDDPLREKKNDDSGHKRETTIVKRPE